MSYNGENSVKGFGGIRKLTVASDTFVNNSEPDGTLHTKI
jgi:hypothetical protein